MQHLTFPDYIFEFISQVDEKEWVNHKSTKSDRMTEIWWLGIHRPEEYKNFQKTITCINGPSGTTKMEYGLRIKATKDAIQYDGS